MALLSDVRETDIIELDSDEEAEVGMDPRLLSETSHELMNQECS